MSWRLVSGLCLLLSGALDAASFAQNQDGGLLGAGQVIVGREGSPPDPRPALPEAEARRLSDHYRRLEALSIKAIAPGSRKAQDAAIDEAIDVAAQALAICEQFQGAQTAAGRAWSDAGGQGEWWELVEARHWWNGWKRMKEVSPAGRTALGLAALMKPQFEAAEKEARWDDAIQISRSQRATLETHLGPSHPYTLESRLNEARMLNAAEKYEEAKVLLEKLIPELAASLGTQHPRTLTGRHELASAYRWSGTPDRAAPLLEGVLRDRRLVLNADHTQTLQAASDLAWVLSGLKQHERAIQVAEELRGVCSKSLGDAHWRTLDAVWTKARELMELGRYEDGLQALEQALIVAEKPRVLGYARRVWRLIGTQASIHHSMAVRSRRDNDGHFERHMNARAESLQKQLQLASEFPDLDEPEQLVAKRAAIADSLASAGQKQDARNELDAAMLGFAALPVQPDSRRIGLISDLGRAAKRADEHVRAEDLLERAWKAIQDVATGDSPNEADDARGSAWLVCIDLMEIRGKHGAVEQGLADIRRWQAIDTRLSPSERERLEGNLWWTLGNALNDAGWPSQSVHAWRTYLERLSAASAAGESVLSAKRGLINALESSDGFVEAEKLCEELLAAAVAEHGEASPTSVRALNSLAYVQSKAGKYDQSAATMRRVLDLSERIKMPPSDVEIYRGNLSKALVDGGHYDEAAQLLESSLVSRRSVFGEWSKETVQIHTGIAELLIEQRRFDEALQRLEALKPKVEEQFGRDSWPYLSVLKSMRSAHQSATRYAEALKLNDEVVAVSRGLCGPARLIYELKLAAVICKVDSDIPGAERYLSEALDLAVAKLGPDDAETLNVLKYRVNQCLDVGDYERMVEFGRRYFAALASRRQREGVLPATTELDSMLLGLEVCNSTHEQRTEFATQLLIPQIQPLLERANAELGMGNLYLRLVKQELGEFFAARGEYEKAIAMHREVLEWYEQRLGPKHKTTLQALNRLGLTQQDQGLLADAVATQRDCLNRASSDAIDLREFRQSLQWNLATSLGAAGQTEEAARLLVELRSSGSSGLRDVGRLAYLPLNERRQRWLQIHRNLGFCMRMTMTSPAGLETALDAAMQRKALLQDLAAIEWATLRAAQDPATAKTLEGLAAAQQALAQASNDETVAPERLAELERRVRDTERLARLAAPSVGRLDEQLRQGVEGVIKALQPGEALVEFVRYFPSQRVSEPESEVVLKESGRPEYTAFVLQTDSSDPKGYRLNVVSLGDSEVLDGLIARFRKYVDRPDPDHIHRPAALLNRREADQRLGVPADLAAILEDLQSRVWDKIAPNLRNASRLYVAMDGALHDLPLEVLARRDAAGVLRYLIEWEGAPEIAYLSSGRELLRWPHGTPKGNGTRQLVAFVDPDFGARASAASRPSGGNPRGGRDVVGFAGRVLGAEVALLGGGGERDELPRISTDVGVPQQFFDGYISGLRGLKFGGEPRAPEALLYSGLEASEATWRRVFAAASEPEARILVFTTHGLWMQPQGATSASVQSTNARAAPDPLLRAGLALAGYNANVYGGTGSTKTGEPMGSGAERDEDGLLTALEVASTDLRGVELVILTACQSGRGVPLPGEAAAGLRAGFSVAGARSTISALWSIPTVRSTNFTRSYLESLVGGRADDASHDNALSNFRASQRELLAKARSEPRMPGTDSPGLGNTHPFWWAGFVYQGVPK